MPNWKKLITSGSAASFSSLLLSDVVNAGADTDKFLVLDAAGNVDFRTGTQVRSDIGAGTLSSVSSDTISDSTAYSRGIITGSSASGTRTHLGLGSLATLSSIDNSNWSGTDLAIANGGTGASTADSARTNLGLGTAAIAATTDFVSATESDTMAGSLTIGDGTADTRLIIKRLDSAVSDDIQFFNGTTRVGEIGTEDTTWLRINQETNKNIYTPRYIRADAGFFVDGTSKGINGSGNFIGGTIAGASDANVSNWDTAYSDRYKWDGGSTGLVAATARTYLGLGTAATSAATDFVAVSGDTMTGTLNMGNNNISAVNQLAFNDPGPDEGLTWSGGNWKLYESPDDLTTNTKGNLQFVSGSTRVMTIGEGGDTALYIEGSGSTVFDVQGSQGQLFSVTDELTGDLFTVADISGVPIFNIDSDASGSMDGRLDVEGTLSGSKAEFSSGLTVTGAITATGDITAYYSSDARLKDNLRPIINATEKLQNISGYEFEWNSNQTMYSGSDIGVVAQEIEQVLPQIVKDRDNGYKAVEYQKLVALLIQSNKELLTRIEELESKIK